MAKLEAMLAAASAVPACHGVPNLAKHLDDMGKPYRDQDSQDDQEAAKDRKERRGGHSEHGRVQRGHGQVI